MKKMLLCLLLVGNIGHVLAEENEIEEEEIAADELLLESDGLKLPGSIPSLEMSESDLKLPEKKSVAFATAMGMIPGAGHLYLDEVPTAVGMFGVTMGGLGMLTSSNQFMVKQFGLDLSFTSIFYSVYASYRDANLYNNPTWARKHMPTDTLWDLATAIVSPRVLIKPEVWGGFILFLAAAIIADKIEIAMSPGILSATGQNLGRYPITGALPAFGEEGFFRGFMQPALMQYFSPATSIALSSIAFGLCHIPANMMSGKSTKEKKLYNLYQIPMFVITGLYKGWIAYKNNSLRETAALHAWWNISFMAFQYYVNTNIQTLKRERGMQSISIPIRF